jgi:phosphonate transport system substrate-binding protein
VAGELRFGISRKHGGDRLLEAAGHFIEALDQALGARLKLVVSFDYEHLLRSIIVGGVELAWLPPVLCAQVGAAVAVCSRAGRLTYRSALLVREESTFRVPRDLQGARVVWTDRQSAAGYLFPRQHLAKHGVDLATLKETFAGSFVQAAAEVDRGNADATATFVDKTDRGEMIADLRRVFGPKVRAIRILDDGVSDPIPADGIAVTSRMPADQKSRITTALCALHRTPPGQTALMELMQADCLVPPTPEVLRAIEGLRGLSSPY